MRKSENHSSSIQNKPIEQFTRKFVEEVRLATNKKNNSPFWPRLDIYNNVSLHRTKNWKYRANLPFTNNLRKVKAKKKGRRPSNSSPSIYPQEYFVSRKRERILKPPSLIVVIERLYQTTKLH